jgi:hypothetical protein
MKACEGKIGLVFVIRLEDEDIVPKRIEQFVGKKWSLSQFLDKSSLTWGSRDCA